MTQQELLLHIARDEAETLISYQNMLDTAENISEDAKATVREIMSDEFNHALKALLKASTVMEINIPKN